MKTTIHIAVTLLMCAASIAAAASTQSSSGRHDDATHFFAFSPRFDRPNMAHEYPGLSYGVGDDSRSSATGGPSGGLTDKN